MQTGSAPAGSSNATVTSGDVLNAARVFFALTLVVTPESLAVLEAAAPGPASSLSTSLLHLRWTQHKQGSHGWLTEPSSAS